VTVMFTGLGDKPKEGCSRVVLSLKGNVSQKVEDCTHLVTDKVHRTVKFLAALGAGKEIVTPDWIHESEKAGYFVGESLHYLKDKEAEASWNFSLNSAREKAANKKLMEGLSFYVTPNTKPSPSDLREIISSCGGKILTSPPHSFDDNVCIISCVEDQKMYSTLIEKGYSVHTTEFILSGVLQQNLDKHTNLVPKTKGRHR